MHKQAHDNSKITLVTQFSIFTAIARFRKISVLSDVMLYMYILGVAVVTSSEKNSLVWLHSFLKRQHVCLYQRAHKRHFMLAISNWLELATYFIVIPTFFFNFIYILFVYFFIIE